MKPINQNEHNQMTPFEYDTRIVEWNLKHDVITKDGLDKFLKSLPDEGGNTEPLHIDDESTRNENAQ